MLPEESTVATAVLLLEYEYVAYSAFPPEYVVAVGFIFPPVLPAWKLMLDGTLSLYITSGFTVTVPEAATVVPVLDCVTEYLIVVVPGPFAVTLPELSTVATAVLLLDHDLLLMSVAFAGTIAGVA